MTKTLTKKTDVAGRKPAETDAQANDSSVPVWKTQHGRVQGALWKHLQPDGKTRLTISISRSYKDSDGTWQNVHYFDEKDLHDIQATCLEAGEEIHSLKNMPEAAEAD